MPAPNAVEILAAMRAVIASINGFALILRRAPRSHAQLRQTQRSWPATAGALNFSRAAEADGNLAGIDDDRNLAPPLGQLEHALEPGVIFEHVDVFEGNFAAGKIGPRRRSVWAQILSKDNDSFVHGFRGIWTAAAMTIAQK